MFLKYCLGWWCETLSSPKAWVIFHWCHQYTIHLWWSCCYCVRLLFTVQEFHFFVFFFLLLFVSTAAFCRPHWVSYQKTESWKLLFLCLFSRRIKSWKLIYSVDTPLHIHHYLDLVPVLLILILTSWLYNVCHVQPSCILGLDLISHHTL